MKSHKLSIYLNVLLTFCWTRQWQNCKAYNLPSFNIQVKKKNILFFFSWSFSTYPPTKLISFSLFLKLAIDGYFRTGWTNSLFHPNLHQNLICSTSTPHLLNNSSTQKFFLSIYSHMQIYSIIGHWLLRNWVFFGKNSTPHLRIPHHAQCNPTCHTGASSLSASSPSRSEVSLTLGL